MELQVSERTDKAAALRAQGLIPAIVYNKQINRPIAVAIKAFDKVFRQASTHGVITLLFPNGERIEAIVKAVAMNKRQRIVEHADFYAVTDEPIEVPVPIHTQGDARGVKEDGGVLDLVLHQVIVRASPKRIPNELTVNIAGMGVNEPLHARDLVLPQGVELVTDGELTVVTIHPPRTEAASSETPSEPEVISKGKREE